MTIKKQPKEPTEEDVKTATSDRQKLDAIVVLLKDLDPNLRQRIIKTVTVFFENDVDGVR